MIAQPLLLLAFLLLIIAAARQAEERFPVIQKVSSAVVCTLLGILLANIGLIPRGGEFMGSLSRYAIPYAIVLFVLSTRLAELKNAGPRMVLGFGLAGFGTFVGAFTASVLFAGLLGPETWKLGGTFAGAFWGGGLNFAAVGQGLEMTPSLFAGAFVVDNLSTVPWMLGQVALASALAGVFLRRAKADAVPEDTDVDTDAIRRTWTEGSVSITHLAILGAIPLLALVAAGLFSTVLPGVPEVLWLTTIALILGQIPAIQRLRGSAMLSYFALHLFFIVIGAGSDVREVVAAGPWLFFYMILIILIHAAVLYGIGWLARFDLATITLSSQAAVGGPGSALALGMALKWKHRIAPAVIMGIFGYGFGNYLGFATAYLLRGVLPA
ncbi:MAG: DUF819 family protein [Acidobacteria bacterium]|nr:DUF819 family protein [Acidobacteriota bacterium]